MDVSKNRPNQTPHNIAPTIAKLQPHCGPKGRPVPAQANGLGSRGIKKHQAPTGRNVHAAAIIAKRRAVKARFALSGLRA